MSEREREIMKQMFDRVAADEERERREAEQAAAKKEREEQARKQADRDKGMGRD